MNAPRSNSGPTTSAAVTSRPTPGIDKGKGKEVAPSPEMGSSTLRIDRRKADEVKPPFNSSARRRRLTDENVLSPAAVVAAAQRGLARPGNTGLPLGNILGGGQGGPGSVNPTGGDRLRGLGGLGGLEMGGLESLGASVNGLAEGLLGSLGRLGPDLFEQGAAAGDNSTNANSGNDTEESGVPGGANSQSSSTTRTGI